MYQELSIFSGNAHLQLAQAICDYLGRPLGACHVYEFSNENIFVEIGENVRQRDVFIIQPMVAPVNTRIMELLIMLDAFRRASAGRITAVIPYFAYGRSDKKDQPRVPITARLLANMLETAGADRILTMDLHAGQIQGFFSIPVDHMTALPLFAQYYVDKGLSGDGVVAVSPDTGRTKLASKFAQMLDADLAIMNKSRPAHDVASVTEVIGRVGGKVAILSDDVIMTGGTLVAAAEALKAAGATEVYACATHGLLPEPAFETLADSDLAEITVTDTVLVDPTKKPDKIHVLSVAGLLAETIHNVFADDSVSAIFQGENQLF